MLELKKSELAELETYSKFTLERRLQNIIQIATKIAPLHPVISQLVLRG